MVVCLEDLVAYRTLLSLLSTVSKCREMTQLELPLQEVLYCQSKLPSADAASSAPAYQLPSDEAQVQSLLWYWSH